jgi:hypothetical protein
MLHILQLILAPMFALGTLYIGPLSVGLTFSLVHYLSSEGFPLCEFLGIMAVVRASTVTMVNLVLIRTPTRLKLPLFL